MSVTPARIPLATYRLQFHERFRLDEARRLVGYLRELGISDAYASPLFRSREHSSHGYDVVDHAAIDPAIGAPADFQAFAEELHAQGLGLMMDIVPNHMGIDDWHNAWWQDVLANGRSSPHAKYFDIDWDPPQEALKDKVLLPVLGEQFGKVLEAGQLQLEYDGEQFTIAYFDRHFPVAPHSWRLILELVLDNVKESLSVENPQRMELESIITAIESLPPRTEQDPRRAGWREREQKVIRRRLATLHATSLSIHEAIERALVEYNGRPGDPRSFDRLEALLNDQSYRLSYWRVAADEINYRRFFDINALAAIRVEDPDVFRAVHAMVFRFLARGWVSQLRIDHPDGLLDPEQYLNDLQDGYRQAIAEVPGHEADAPLYVAVEKILAREESLPPQWPVCGTTGYDFLNLLNGVLVDRRGAFALGAAYVRFTGQTTAFADVLYASKLTILNYSMSSELHVLAGQLARIAQQHRWSRDFTRSSLRRALREVIACFPVYRSYVRPGDREPTAEDRRRILAAIRAAKWRNPAMDPLFFDFIASVLLLEHPDGLAEEDLQERMEFVLKFQQVTSPVMAKGMEDTAFYRWYPLASLNEVGGDPATPGATVEEFHRRNAERLAAWPYTMLATATHDTKRGEDVRARLDVLSEIPEEWDGAIRRWRSWNEPHRTQIEGNVAPDANEEYLLYQTLVGTWPRGPLAGQDHEMYVQRIIAYMDKALKEAKLHTSWVNPNEPYDQAVAHFIQAALDEKLSRRFLDDLDAIVRSLADAGWVNSLAQTALKICLPGVSDFYQGTELWDFNLVDPDNRRSVDFDHRCRLLAELQTGAGQDLPGLAANLLAEWPDERLKLLLVWRTLGYRRYHKDVLLDGSYLPLTAEGPRSENLVAFARQHENDWLLVVVPRLVAGAWRNGDRVEGDGTDDAPRPDQAPVWQTLGMSGSGPGTFAAWWQATTVVLPTAAPRRWRHVVSGGEYSTNGSEGYGSRLEVGSLLAQFPVAILEGSETS